MHIQQNANETKSKHDEMQIRQNANVTKYKCDKMQIRQNTKVTKCKNPIYKQSKIQKKQAEAELGQAQPMLGLQFS